MMVEQSFGRIGSGPGVFLALTPGLTDRIKSTDWRATVNGTRTCSVDECQRRVHALGLCPAHHGRMMRWGDPLAGQQTMRESGTFEDRFWAKVRPTGFCWEWTASLTNGYGSFRWRGRTKIAHREAYQMLVGPIPVGLQIDHLCKNRQCVNPDHLEPVTAHENQMRSHSVSGINAAKTHCKRGHEFTPENTYVYGRSRQCRTCLRARGAMRYQRQNAALSGGVG